MITSPSNATIKRFAKLHQKKYREKEKLMIIEGPHLVDIARSKGLIHTVFTLEGSTDSNTVQVSELVMKKLTKTNHVPPVAAVAKMPIRKSVSEKVLILEHVQDPGNVGTLIRTALAFGFETVVLDQSADPYSAKVLRSTQGAIFDLTLLEMDVKTFKNTYPNYTLIGTELSGETTAWVPSKPYAVILGNEGQGMNESSRGQCDVLVKIPIDSIDSLNVGIAGGIIMHALTNADRPLFKL
ncbi:MAG: TrmH family RNA methyltransferase [Bacillota bacterium]